MSKQEFSVTIRKVLTGEVTIEADSYEEALKIADEDMLSNMQFIDSEVSFNSEHWDIPDLC